MKKKALLVIGEAKIAKNRPYVSFGKFVRYAQRICKRKALEFKVIRYEQLLSGRIPQISAAQIKIVLFFPYRYWNRNIETYQDGRLYGDAQFGREFKLFFQKVQRAIEQNFADKKISYLNPPQVCYLDRDKLASKKILDKNTIPTPRTFRVSSFSGIQKLLDKNINLYIKPRFGAMGKGISFVDKENLISNFIFRKGKIISRLRDFNWRFASIKDKQPFLDKLLKKRFICEEAIEPATFKDRRFDFRIYVIFNDVVYMYAKSNQDKAWVTNWSQGGRIDKRKKILRSIPDQKLFQMKDLARRATRALGLNFAGIDVIFSKDLKKAYVLEGNAFPGHEKGFNLMKCLLDYVIK